MPSLSLKQDKGSNYHLMFSEETSISCFQGRYVISPIRIYSYGLEEFTVFIAKINPSHNVSFFPVNSLFLKKSNQMFFQENTYHQQKKI